MLRISQIGQANHSVTLRFEGQIVGAWVAEARQTCEQLLRECHAVKLNLADVSFLDQDGVKLLRDLVVNGVTLIDCSLFVEEQLKTTQHDSGVQSNNETFAP